MNKYKEALNILKIIFKPRLTWVDSLVINRYLLFMEELVEKATPKKPIEYPSFASGYKCPNCECNIVLHGSHEICPTPHCSWCGQALDWEIEVQDE